MKTIASWNDLAPFGIIPLTGESCGLTYRLLCDVTGPGKRIIEKCFGCELNLPESWNRSSDDSPHVGSIMRPFRTSRDRFLRIFRVADQSRNGCVSESERTMQAGGGGTCGGLPQGSSDAL